MAAREPIDTCPYTGDTFTMEHVMGRGWIPQGLFDPLRGFLTEDIAWRVLSRRKGVDAEPGVRRDRCPYTGKRFTVEQRSDGKWYARGLFGPVRLYPNLYAAEDLLSTRGGVKPKIERVKVRRVDDPTDEPSDVQEGVQSDLDPIMEKLERKDAE